MVRGWRDSAFWGLVMSRRLLAALCGALLGSAGFSVALKRVKLVWTGVNVCRTGLALVVRPSKFMIFL